MLITSSRPLCKKWIALLFMYYGLLNKGDMQIDANINIILK